MICLIIVLVALSLFYVFVKRRQNYWKYRDVPQTNPIFLLGDTYKLVIKQQNMAMCIKKIYDLHPNSRYVGMYQGTLPTLLIKDPELLKQLTIKDFQYFVDHNLFVPDNDPYWGRNLFALKGKKWQDMRATLSPAFTACKLKSMFRFMEECAIQFTDHFQKMNESVVSVDIKEEFRRYTNDVISICAFGLKCNTIEERTNAFFEMGCKASDFSSYGKLFKLFGYVLAPDLFKKLGIKLFPQEVGTFFKDILIKTIKFREETGTTRPDMINLLMQAKNGLLHDGDKLQKTLIDDNDIIGQALIFFLAGFDSVSSQMTFTAYELALNPDVQERLFNEINKALKLNNGEIDYDLIQSLQYLDMIILESLRKWPAIPASDRICANDYKVSAKSPLEKDFTIEKGTSLWLPIAAINRDPKYFPNPDKFDPERFSEENRDKLVFGPTVSFGFGQRICIGSRFAIMEIKIVIVHLLKTFKLVKVDRTRVEKKSSIGNLNFITEEGHWIGLQKRN